MQQKIIDCHNHMWKLEENDNFSWIKPGMDIIKRDFSFKDLNKVLTEHQISGSIVVQAIPVTDETVQILDLANKQDIIKGVIGWCDVSLGAKSVQKSIDLFKQHGTHLKGIRNMSQGLPAKHLIKNDFIEAVKQIGKNDLVYELLITHDQLPEAIKLVEACPEVTFVLEHIAKPNIKAHDIDTWRENIAKLAKASDKIYCKVSGMVTEADWHNWQENDFFPYIDTIYENFGEDYMLFGSDWPVCQVAAKYEQVLGIVQDWLTKHSKVNPDKLFYQNAIKVYKLN